MVLTKISSPEVVEAVIEMNVKLIDALAKKAAFDIIDQQARLLL